MVKVSKINKTGPHIWLGTFLRKRRIEIGISQKEMSAHLGQSSRGLMSNIERGTAQPASHHVLKICEVLKIHPETYLLVSSENHRESLGRKIGVIKDLDKEKAK